MGPTRGCLEGGRRLKERFVYVHILINYRDNKQVSFLLYKLNKTNMFSLGGGACIRQGVFIREGCRRRGIY